MKLLMDRAQARGLAPLVEWMPYRHTRGQIFEAYEALQRQNVEDWELIIRHIGHPDKIPDLIIEFNGLLTMLHGAMFQAFDSETRRRARHIVSFFKGKHAQLFHATSMLKVFDESGLEDSEWLSPALDAFLEEPVGPSLNDELLRTEVDFAGSRFSRSSALFCQASSAAARWKSRELSVR